MSGIVTFGESLAMLTTSDPCALHLADSLLLRTGGSESNVAIAAARLGISATWMGRVGDDPAGRRVLRDLRGEGVRVLATVDQTAPTGLMLKERRHAGRSHVHYWRDHSAGAAITWHDLDQQAIRTAEVLHVTGITAGLSESASHAVECAVQLARSAGVRVSFDVNHRTAVWKDRDPRSVYRRLASAADVVFTGMDESPHLLGRTADALEVANTVRGWGVPEVVITDGPAPALAVSSDGVVECDPPRVHVADTVGAGDAFVAAYLSGVLEELTPLARLARACRAGANACTEFGDWEGAPTLQELDGPRDESTVVR